MATWDDVASIVGELQLTDERSPREWRVGKKLIVWERPLRKSDREALAALGIEPPEGDILVGDPRAEDVAFGGLNSQSGQSVPIRLTQRSLPDDQLLADPPFVR